MAEQEDVDEKIYKMLAGEFSFSPAMAKQLGSFIKFLHNFSQYMGAHKYYSDALNKRVAMLILESDLLALSAEKLRLENEEIYSQMEIAHYSKKEIDAKKKAELKAKVDDFKVQISNLTEKALELHSSATKLMQDIKTEYASTSTSSNNNRTDY